MVSKKLNKGEMKMTHGEQDALLSLLDEIEKNVGKDIFSNVMLKIKLNPKYEHLLDEYFYRLRNIK